MAIDLSEYDYIENPYYRSVEVFGQVQTCYGVSVPNVDFFRALGIYARVRYYQQSKQFDVDCIPVYWGRTNIPQAGVQHG